MIPRLASKKIREKVKRYPVIALVGPRQSGKSTLAKSLFPKKPYVSFEDLDQRQFALNDPRGFLNLYPNGAVFDEVHHCPDLLSYLQTLVDNQKKMGMFILTSSQQFGFGEKVSQSLAGRVGLIQLLPFSLTELQDADLSPKSLEKMLYTGFYPPIYDRKINPHDWYSDYVSTYLERDVRQLTKVHDLILFHHFIKMCAARTGQLLNLNSLANDCGITHNTAKAWISVLSASYVIFLLQPHFRNFNKRLIKSPKLYFYDTGLACFLNNIENFEQLSRHSLRGQLFETFVVSELIKQRFNQGLLSNLYFWRDNVGHEIDVLLEQGEKLIPLEIKSGATINQDYFSGIEYWQKLTEKKIKGWLVYAGDHTQNRSIATVLTWQDLREIKN